MKRWVWSPWTLLLSVAVQVAYVVTGGLLHVVLGLCVVLYGACLFITRGPS